MIDTVFMDVDGVLADFVSAAFAAHKRDVAKWPRCEWDICRHWGMTDEDFWVPLDTAEFWQSVKPYYKAREFLEEAYDVCNNADAQLVFCTQSSLHVEHFMPARMALLREMAHPETPNVVITTRGKAPLAAHTKLLVDDNQSHVSKFRAAGGRAILSPMHWNVSAGVTINDKIPGLVPDYEFLLARLMEELR